MAIATRRDIEAANRRYEQNRKRKHVLDAINDHVTNYNVIGVGTFKVGGIYQVTWLVDGRAVGHNIFTIPEDECQEQTATEWFHTLVKSIMFGFDVEHADLIVSEVINDLPTNKAV